MAANEPIDPRVRLAISQWPDDSPRGAVSTFCAKNGISRKSFYELRKRAKSDGPAKAFARSRASITIDCTVIGDTSAETLGLKGVFRFYMIPPIHDSKVTLACGASGWALTGAGQSTTNSRREF